MRRAGGRAAFAVVFALLALNAWAQVVLVPFGRSSDPATLTALQLLVGTAAAAAAWASWRGMRWAPAAALVYGALAATMVVLLGPILHLDEGARGGLWTGAALIVLFCAWAAWSLRRSVARAGVGTTHPGET